VSDDLSGVWKFAAWRRIAEDGSVSHPLGEDAHGQLVYTPAARWPCRSPRPGARRSRPAIRWAVTCRRAPTRTRPALAYFGRYEVRGDTVVHSIDVSLFPNWTGAEQARPFTLAGGELTLRTPPQQTATGTVVNELAWIREDD